MITATIKGNDLVAAWGNATFVKARAAIDWSGAYRWHTIYGTSADKFASPEKALRAYASLRNIRIIECGAE